MTWTDFTDFFTKTIPSQFDLGNKNSFVNKIGLGEIGHLIGQNAKGDNFLDDFASGASNLVEKAPQISNIIAEKSLPVAQELLGKAQNVASKIPVVGGTITGPLESVNEGLELTKKGFQYVGGLGK